LNTSVVLPPIRFMDPTHAKFYDFVASALQMPVLNEIFNPDISCPGDQIQIL
jgi:hypothetical protein